MRQNLFIQFSRSCYFQGGGSLLLGGCYFQEVATFSGIYKRPQKMGINFREDATYRESLLSELLWYGQFRMLKIPKCEHFTLQIVTPADRVTLPGRLDNPPRQVTLPIM